MRFGTPDDSGYTQRSVLPQSALRVQSLKTHTPISSVIDPRGCTPGSGQFGLRARLISVPHTPWVMLVDDALKQSPRHCVLRGAVSPGGISVIEGLHAEPSARRVRFAGAPQKPVRVLHEVPPVHWLFEVQKGKHPAVSGVCCESERVLQAQPARHMPAPAVQAAVQKPSPVAASRIRQVEELPPQALRSVVCEVLLVQAPVHVSIPAKGWHCSVEPHDGSLSEVHARPAVAVPPPPPVQTPFEQVCPDAQALRHEPQFCALFSGFTQLPPHEMLGAVQPPPPVQVPLEQDCPDGHARLQKPQCWVLLSTSTHSAPHIILGAMQGCAPAHTPFWQVCPAVHARPQMPQFCESVRVFTHTPPQEVCGDVQVVPPVHAPPTQAWPPAQALPQTPQFCALVCVSTHSEPHIIRGLWQLGAVTQVPAVQTLPSTQARPHIPQFMPSLSTFTHAPPHDTSGSVHPVEITSEPGFTTSSVFAPASSSGPGKNTPLPARAAHPIMAASAAHTSKVDPLCLIDAPRLAPFAGANSGTLLRVQQRSSATQRS